MYTCKKCEGTGFQLDHYLKWLSSCINEKTRVFTDEQFAFGKLIKKDYKLARKKLIKFINNSDFKKAPDSELWAKGAWTCPVCKATGKVDWVTNCIKKEF